MTPHDTLEETLAQIAQRHSARLNSPWSCKACGAEQAPPPSDDGECGACTRTRTQRLAATVPAYLVEQVGIPTRFVQAEWECPPALRKYVGLERGLLLRGPAGVGKTVAVCLLAREACLALLERHGRLPTPPEWRFLSFPAFVMELQDAWRREDTERTALWLLRQAVAVPRLIVDDLGAEKLTDYVRQATYYLINEREQWERPTYLTSNFDLGKLDEQFDSRISSRIAGMCDVMSMQGKDRRLT